MRSPPRATVPTPIQAQAIPVSPAGPCGIAQTGTGKTAAFALPILQRLADARQRRPRAATRVLVLTPTRELAAQIAESFALTAGICRLRAAVVFGGVGIGPQIAGASRAASTSSSPRPAACSISWSRAVRPLERSRCSCSTKPIACSTWASSRRPPHHRAAAAATPDAAVLGDDAAAIAGARRRASCATRRRSRSTPAATTAERIEQCGLFVDSGDKRALLVDLLRDPACRARARLHAHQARRQPGRRAARAGRRSAPSAIHGNKSQSARERALDGFKSGQRRVLVATDIAARGIDVDGITHVVQLRPAERARELRPPHRPHRARRRHGHRDLVLRCGGAGLSARHREADPHALAGERGARGSRNNGRAFPSRAAPYACAPATTRSAWAFPWTFAWPGGERGLRVASPARDLSKAASPWRRRRKAPGVRSLGVFGHVPNSADRSSLILDGTPTRRS